MTLYGEKKETCVANPKTVSGYARRVAHGHWSFLGPGSEKKWYGTHTYKPNGEWDHGAEDMTINPSESEHPVFRGTSTFERGSTQSKGVGQLSVHFSGDTDTIEVVLRTIISVNQLNVYGAVADMCDELASRNSDCSESTGKLEAENKSETMVVSTGLSTTTKPLLTNETAQGDLLPEYER